MKLFKETIINSLKKLDQKEAEVLLEFSFNTYEVENYDDAITIYNDMLLGGEEEIFSFGTESQFSSFKSLLLLIDKRFRLINKYNDKDDDILNIEDCKNLSKLFNYHFDAAASIGSVFFEKYKILKVIFQKSDYSKRL